MERIVKCYNGCRSVQRAQTRGSVALTALQDPRTQFILHHTKPPNTPWAGMRAVVKNTIPSQQVRSINDPTTWICR
jgi:hypothetical protein